MRHRMLIGGGVLATAIVLGALVRDRPAAAAVKDDEQSIQKAIDDYCTAFNKGDANGILAIWAADAEYIDETGKSIKGHGALAAMFKLAVTANKGAKVQIKTGSIRFFNDVCWQDGSAVLTQVNGDTESSPFTAVWTKKDGKWLLSLVREPQAQRALDKDEPNPHLKQLGWLVGDWVHEDKESKITFSAKWMKGDKFLVINLEVTHNGGETMSLIKMVGWDPLANQLRSWMFDTRGGFGEGTWSRNGDTWTVEATGVTADGRRGSGKHHWKLVDDHTITWEGTDREVGGQLLPDVSVTYQHVKNAK